MINTDNYLGQLTKYTCYTFSIIPGIKYYLCQLTCGFVHRQTFLEQKLFTNLICYGTVYAELVIGKLIFQRF
jgi:hypothetical protein